MRTAVAVIVLAALAFFAWLVVDWREAPAPSREADAVAKHDAVAAMPATGEAPAGTAPSAANERVAVPPPLEGPSGEVLVVAFARKAPIAGATVSCATNGAWTGTSDAEGRCRVPLVGEGAHVVATTGALRAEGWLAASATQPLVLALRPDCTLHVCVVDSAGKPVPGVQVLARRAGERPMDFGFGATDAAGRCTKPHLQELAGDAATCRLDVFARFPGGETAAVAIEATEPPPDVVLRLPATGQLVVHVRDAGGNPMAPLWLGNPSVRLATWTERPDVRAASEGMRSEIDAPIDEHGDAVFAVVALDRFVLAEAGSRVRSEVVPGPTLANPRVEVIARESRDDAVFTGTLLDADGRRTRKPGTN